jgi:tetratricopeptide (TPR) repeat protein
MGAEQIEAQLLQSARLLADGQPNLSMQQAQSALEDAQREGHAGLAALALARVATAQVRLGSFDEAIAAFDASVDLGRRALADNGPQLVELLLLRVAGLAELSKSDQAEGDLRELLRILPSGDPQRARARGQLGILLASGGDNLGALEECRRACSEFADAIERLHGDEKLDALLNLGLVEANCAALLLREARPASEVVASLERASATFEELVSQGGRAPSHELASVYRAFKKSEALPDLDVELRDALEWAEHTLRLAEVGFGEDTAFWQLFEEHVEELRRRRWPDQQLAWELHEVLIGRVPVTEASPFVDFVEQIAACLRNPWKERDQWKEHYATGGLYRAANGYCSLDEAIEQLRLFASREAPEQFEEDVADEGPPHA